MDEHSDQNPSPAGPVERRKAVALRFRPDQHRAPVVLGKGEGLVADRLLEIAHRHGIPVREDPDLVQVLSKLDLNNEIPDHVYRAVARILAFVYESSRDFQWEISVSYFRQGDQRWSAGDLEGAVRSWRTALAGFEQLGDEQWAESTRERLAGG